MAADVTEEKRCRELDEILAQRRKDGKGGKVIGARELADHGKNCPTCSSKLLRAIFGESLH